MPTGRRKYYYECNATVHTKKKLFLCKAKRNQCFFQSFRLTSVKFVRNTHLKWRKSSITEPLEKKKKKYKYQFNIVQVIDIILLSLVHFESLCVCSLKKSRFFFFLSDILLCIDSCANRTQFNDNKHFQWTISVSLDDVTVLLWNYAVFRRPYNLSSYFSIFMLIVTNTCAPSTNYNVLITSAQPSTVYTLQ